MKKFKIYIAALVFACVGLIILFNLRESKAENCCAKCTGSANCRACKTCNYCAHCNSGGSCGVCSYSTPVPKKTYVVPKSIPNESKNNSSTNIEISITSNYYVNIKTLNIRSTPSTSSEIVYVCKYGEKIIQLKIVDEKWANVEVNGITGYAYRQYISKK